MSSWICRLVELQKLKHGFRQPAFWEYQCCMFALRLGNLNRMSVSNEVGCVPEAWEQGRLFCKVCFCVSALCALQMCLTWCAG